MIPAIQTQITKLQDTKDELRTAIMEKGVIVQPSDLFSTYPTRISQISTTSGTFDESLKKLLDGTYTSYSIPEGTSVLRKSAFNSYTSLTSITIPTTLTHINENAFLDCTSLSTVNISDLTAWCKITFDYSNGDYTSNPLAKAHRLYLNGTLLTNLVIPSGITSINACAFYLDTSLTSVVVHDNVTSIGDRAFMECTGLRTVEIGTGITRIGVNAFQWCSNLTSITIKATTPPTIFTATFTQTNNCPIYVPAASVDAYKAAWSTYASRIQAINTFALKFTPKNGGAVTEVELEDLATPGTISISDVPSTIRNVEGSLEIGEGVTTIDNGGVFQALQITVVTIPDSVTTIGTSAFWNCTRLTSVTIPNSITYIDESVFDGCSSLASITIPDSVTAIRQQAFRACTGLASVSIGNNVTTIGDTAFFGDTSLTSVNIPDSVTSLGLYAFEDCSSLASVVIGTGIEEIGNNQFGLYRQSSSALTSVTIKATTPPTIGAAIFDDENTGEVVNPNLVIYVPAESVNAYKAASGWSDYASRIQAIPS